MLLVCLCLLQVRWRRMSCFEWAKDARRERGWDYYQVSLKFTSHGIDRITSLAPREWVMIKYDSAFMQKCYMVCFVDTLRQK
jgi:hypothetical protein